MSTRRTLVTIEEAREILARTGEPVHATERCALAALPGRVLATPLVADHDVPAFARSAMDGYAIIAADTSGADASRPIALHVIDDAWAGRPSRETVRPGTSIAIATGARLPAGADAVVMVEETTREGDRVLVRRPVQHGQHVSPRGGDLAGGHVALDEGVLLTPARVGVVAAIGLTAADVYLRPRVSVLSTGDEVVSAGQPLGNGQVHDVNSHTLAAILAANGGEPLLHPHVPDDRDAVGDAVRASLDADLVLVSGGSSIGGRDYVFDVLAELGDIRFEGIAVKPGKPTVLAVIGGRPVIGMPGNPTSCLSNGYLLVGPLVRRLARLPPAEPRVVRARLARAVTSPAGRHQFYTVRVAEGRVIPAFKGSGDITSMADADGYFEIPAERERVEEDEEVNVTLF